MSLPSGRRAEGSVVKREDRGRRKFPAVPCHSNRGGAERRQGKRQVAERFADYRDLFRVEAHQPGMYPFGSRGIDRARDKAGVNRSIGQRTISLAADEGVGNVNDTPLLSAV
jgi:hypothetical protein